MKKDKKIRELTKKRKWYITFLFWMPIMVLYFFGGFMVGMVYQQVLITQQVIGVLSSSDVEINVDFNETILIDGFREVMNDTIKELNKTRWEEIEK